MEKVVVAIADVRAIDQLLALPTRYVYADKEWVITYPSDTYPIFSVSENREVFAHDMLIQPRWNVLDQHPFNKRRKTWYLDRYDKINQNVHLENVLGMFGLQYYQPLPVSEINFDLPKVTYHFDSGYGKYVIKPTGGARSLGIIFVEEPINLRELLAKMKPMLNNKDTTNEQYFELWHHFGLRYHKGEENRENEMAKVLADNTLVIQQMNPFDDVVEFRVISGTDKPLMFARDHLHAGKHNVFDTIVNEKSKLIDQEIYQEIMLVFSTGKLQTYGSHDIWYSAKGKCWGIYEYQTQYGHNHIPEQLHIEYMKDVIATAYSRLTGEVVFNSYN